MRPVWHDPKGSPVIRFSESDKTMTTDEFLTLLQSHVDAGRMFDLTHGYDDGMETRLWNTDGTDYIDGKISVSVKLKMDNRTIPVYATMMRSLIL